MNKLNRYTKKDKIYSILGKIIVISFVFMLLFSQEANMLSFQERYFNINSGLFEENVNKVSSKQAPLGKLKLLWMEYGQEVKNPLATCVIGSTVYIIGIGNEYNEYSIEARDTNTGKFLYSYSWYSYSWKDGPLIDCTVLDNYLYVVGGNGVWHILKFTPDLKLVKKLNYNFNVTSNVDVNTIATDGKFLYVGGDTGDNEQWHVIKVEPSNLSVIKNYTSDRAGYGATVHFINVNPFDGRIWLVGMANGIGRIQILDDDLLLLTSKDLSFDIISSKIAFDESGYAYIIGMYDDKRKKILLKVSPNLQIVEVNYLDADIILYSYGYLYLATSKYIDGYHRHVLMKATKDLNVIDELILSDQINADCSFYGKKMAIIANKLFVAGKCEIYTPKVNQLWSVIYSVSTGEVALESTVLFVGEIVQHNLKEKQCVIKVHEVFKSFTLAAYETEDPLAKFVEVRSKEFTWEKEIINSQINVYWDSDALDKIIEKTKPGDVVEVLGLLIKDPNGEIHAEVKLKENLYHFIVPGIFLRAYISKFIIHKDYDPLDKNTAANVYFKINVQGIDDNWNGKVDEKGEYARIPTLEDKDIKFIKFKKALWEIVVEETDINKELTGPMIAIIHEKTGESAIQPYPVPIKMHIEVWDEDAFWWDKKIAEFELFITKEELQASNYNLSKWLGSKDQGVSLEISFEPLLPRDTTLYVDIAKIGLYDLGFNFYDTEALDAIMKLFNGKLPKIEEVKVAIIEWGYPDKHPEWEGAISEVWDCTGDCKLVEPDVASGKGDDHASMVAGVAISKIDGKGAAGLAWNAKLIIIASKPGNLEKAIRKAVDRGAKVISFSILSTNEPGIESAIKYALDNGVVLIAAAGNEFTSKPYFPQSFESVIKVAGVTRIEILIETGLLWPFGISLTQAPYSNYGKYTSFDVNMKMRVDFSAPATIYRTTSLGGEYTLGTGTSSAAPVIASIVAILQGFAKSLYGRYLTINEVYEILKQVSIDLGKPGWDPYYGWGLVNVTKAIEIIKKGIPKPTINIVKDPTLRSGTVITLSSEGSQLLLHVLDEKGNILFGFDENQGEIISSIIGAEHLILENYSLIYLPINMGNLRIVVDAKYAHMDTERGNIKITSIRNSEVIDEKELEFIIKKNESLNYGVSISENGNILTFTPTPTPSPSPTLPTPTQPPSPTSPTLPVTSPIQSPTKSPSAATPLNIELIIIIIVIAATLASLVIVFRKYKAK
jgi:hypothetical protein